MLQACERKSPIAEKKMQPKKIVLFGLFGQQNLGNECTLQAMIYHTRRCIPDAEIKCVCTGPEDTREKYGIPTFEMYAPSGEVRPGRNNTLLSNLKKIVARAWRELNHGVRGFRMLKGNDLLIVPGTGLLVDHTTGFRGYPFYVFKWSFIAKLCRCKLLIMSIGAGPIYHRLSRWFIKFALSQADKRSYRDAFSKNYIESIGFETNNDPVYPDLAFSLPRAIMSAQRSSQSQRRVVGLGVLDYYGPSGKLHQGGEAAYRDYIHKMATFVNWLIEHKYGVRMLIGDIKYDSNVSRDLMELLKERGLKNEYGQIINEPIFSVEHLVFQLGASDVVVSPRYHNVILALMLNKPVISLSYNEKFDSLMAALGLSDYCLRIDKLDVQRLIEQFIELEKNGKQLKSRIQQKIEEYRKALDKQYTIIFNDV